MWGHKGCLYWGFHTAHFLRNYRIPKLKHEEAPDAEALSAALSAVRPARLQFWVRFGVYGIYLDNIFIHSPSLSRCENVPINTSI